MSERITMSHGAGGTIMQDLIKRYIVAHLGGSGVEVPLEALDDSAVVDEIVLKSDSHTVKPLFFPGGDIGRMAISGTVNDIAVMGADPIALAAGFILEEGFPIGEFEKIVSSMKETCKEAGVYVVTGDTKVVEKGALDKFVINTSGIGKRSEALESNIQVVKKYRPFNSRWLLDSNIREGDKLLVSGTVGDHGIAVLSFREGYGFDTEVKSDVAPLNKLAKRILMVGGIVKIKDPTRGGLSNALNEWSDKSKIGILIHEDAVPIGEGVRAACEMLGIDPLEVGNEGKLVIATVPGMAEQILDELKATPKGKSAAIIGEATHRFDGVVMETAIGGRRIVSAPAGDPVPRIC